MYIRRFPVLFTLFLVLPVVLSCILSSTQKAANKIMYSIAEYTDELNYKSFGLYVVDETGDQPREIYRTQTNQLLRARFSPDGSKVIILSWRQIDKGVSAVPGASFTLVTMDADGKNTRTWIEDQEVKIFSCLPTARFSTDSKRFLYIAPATDKCDEYLLYTATPDGKEKVLIDRANRIEAEFTPKGDRLLVSRQMIDTENRQTTYEIYYVSAKGGDPEIVWGTQERGSIVSVTYGGSDQVLLAIGQFSTGEVELSLMSDDFQEKTPVARFRGNRAIMPILSHDARYLGLGRQGDVCTIFSVIELATGEMRDISCWYEGVFQFSSNGKYLLVPNLGEYGVPDGVVGYDQMLLTPDGDLVEILSPPDYMFCTFSPDGKRLAYWRKDATTNEACLHIRKLESGEDTILDDTCTPRKTNFPGLTEWK